MRESSIRDGVPPSEGYATPRWMRTKSSSPRGVLATVATAVILFFLCVTQPWPSQNKHGRTLWTAGPSKPTHFRLLIPASERNTRLCKALSSAAVLDYPSPTLINWNKTFDDKKLVSGGSHIGKIDGLLNYLNTLDTKYDDDLVLVVDGYDTWFQLRPSVLLERYYDINRKANERIRKQFGKAAVVENLSQNVLFSTQKRCWPKGPNHPSCFAVPESTLPQDVYGPQTDTDIGDEKNPYIKFRPRYLNSGSVIGSVGAMRAVYERASEKARIDKNFGSDQAILTEIFGEQEFQRHVAAQRHRSIPTMVVEWFKKKFGTYYSPVDRDTAGEHELMEAEFGRTYEFGIGLDYDGLISQPTVFAEEDLEWIHHTDTPYISKASERLGLATPRVSSVSDQIMRSRPPFHSLIGAHTPSGVLPPDQSWQNVPLFTNMWSGVVPASIHHNAHRDGMKSRNEEWWNRTWYYPHLRALLDDHVLEPVRPIAVLKDSSTEQRHEWWSAQSERSVVDSDSEYPMRLDQLCEESWQELFRDELGAWKDPRFVYKGGMQKNNYVHLEDWIVAAEAAEHAREETEEAIKTIISATKGEEMEGIEESENT